MLLLPLLLLSTATAPNPAVQTTLPAGTWELRFSPGAGIDFAGYLGPRLDGSVAWGITDRVQVMLLWPSLTVRFGEPGALESWVAAGLFGVRPDPLGFLAFVRYELGPTAGVRWWLNPSVAFAGSLEVSSTRWLGIAPVDPGFTFNAGGGVTLAVNDSVTVHLALAARQTLSPSPSLLASPLEIGLGSVQRLAMRRPPLLQVRVLPFLTWDVNASVWGRPSGITDIEALVGVTARWG